MVAVLALAYPLAAAPVARCVRCHAAESSRQPGTGMAHAMETAQACQVLRNHPRLSARLGSYTYQIEYQGDRSIYTVTDGKATITVPLTWAFGRGAAGQTYLYERDGAWYEGRVSFYNETQSLDLTMGGYLVPRTLDEAAGRRMSSPEARDCFQCHATGGVKAGKLDVAALTPGVQCERCHGSAEAHLEALNGRAPAKALAMRKLGATTAEQMADFCGQCHGTWSRITTDGPRGVFNVRYQPYRLANSKCYDSEDRRIRCTSCHDPHQDAITTAAEYDAKCLDCHSGRHPSRNAQTCKVAKKQCVTCHMPKTELPGAHHKFTDHRIRIVRAGDAYPD
jgi:hypothetical protein